MNQALNPQRSVIVEACAGSGKTWQLVSRIIRLLLDGVKPSEILAITFTRKAAQEMQMRLREWLYDLASHTDEEVKDFLKARGLVEHQLDELLPRARSLYQQFLFAQPSITISTFHGWFMQILQRAPLNAGLAGGVQLVEQTAALRDEAWKSLLDRCNHQTDSPEAQALLQLFKQQGLSNTQKLIEAFLDKRSEWWAYTTGKDHPLTFALQQLQAEWQIDLNNNPIAALLNTPSFRQNINDFTCIYAQNGSDAQCKLANNLQIAFENQDFESIWRLIFTTEDKIKATIKANKKQDEAAIRQALYNLAEPMQQAQQQVQAQQDFLLNQQVLQCGVALLDCYQNLKQRQQMLDFGDLEWQAYLLLNNSEFAEYMQYKLDSRYRHVLLDEFQDTNPLQWLILEAWFDAAAAVDSMPQVFVVGDPKQSIYRFRRADARLFGKVRDLLTENFAAEYITQNTTRRNAPNVLACVNAVFENNPDYPIFKRHEALETQLQGWVEALPLLEMEKQERITHTTLRNPLLMPFQSDEETARDLEAEQFADKLQEIVGNWVIKDGNIQRPARYSDIMVLVRRRTYLQTYERALRKRHIPYITSRRGGLLDTLEAQDLLALLTFLITPFANLQLAHTLRSPIFGCTDQDLMQLALGEGTWWMKLQTLETCTPTLERARTLLAQWQVWADKLPVHDLLDRVYFEGNVIARYQVSVPDATRAGVLANLQAFLEISLDIDAGRYPSLPRFLQALGEYQKSADDEAPDEGTINNSGNALLIYTVHQSKGLEAPIVWLLDCNTTQKKEDGHDVLVNWPLDSKRPQHFSVYTDKTSRGGARSHYFAEEQRLSQQEDLNLLYVAMTRAKQALLVSGNGKPATNSWYMRIAQIQTEQKYSNPLLLITPSSVEKEIPFSPSNTTPDTRLTQPMPLGARRETLNDAQRYGVWLHAALEQITLGMEIQLSLPADQLRDLEKQARHILASEHLQRFFDPQHYLSASNEVSYINNSGELRRIDRLVEFNDEIWVLDYKSSSRIDMTDYQSQLDEYERAIRAIYPSKQIYCAIISGNGQLLLK